MLTPKSAITVALLLVAISSGVVTVNAEETLLSPEALYRKTLETWQRKHSRRSKTSWEVWKEFARTVTSRYEEIIGKDGAGAVSNPSASVEMVGAIEEGILTIERIEQSQKHHGSEDDNNALDASLAVLYTEYGRLLLYSSETATPATSETHRCYELAKDPHTLLIGAPERLKEYNAKTTTNTESNTELRHSLFGPLCLDNAENALRNAKGLDEGHSEEAQHLLDKLLESSEGGKTTQTRKPKEFVAELFDSFADTFDEKLTKTLDYRVPQIIGVKVGEILKANQYVQVRNVLDAGCGTGLAGRELLNAMDERYGTITMIGVDASKKMLDIASRCTLTKGCGLPGATAAATNNENKDKDKDKDPKLYNALIDLDLEEMTLENTLGMASQKNQDSSSGHFDLIVAADVFVYFGSLNLILEVFSGLQPSQGILVFTCERIEPEKATNGFQLMPTGRFAHTKDHVLRAATASGYSTLLDYSEIVPRTEKGSPVDGHLFVFQKSPQSGSGDSSGEL